MRIACLNVWALPWGLARDLEARLAAIGASLAGLAADVVALQEVWTRAALDSLIESGRRAGLPHARFGGTDAARGGLLVLSRFPVARARFETYALRGLPEAIWHGDYYADKGFLSLQLETPAGRVAFVNTHLVAQYAPDEGDDYFRHRVGQAVQLAARLREIRGPLVAAGDFNLREERPEYRVLAGLAGLRDLAAELDRREPTVLAANPYRRSGDQRIDYVWVRDGAGTRVVPGSLRRSFDAPPPPGSGAAAYSDHAGLVAELELVPGAARAAPAPEPAAAALAAELLEQGRAAAARRRGSQRAAAGIGIAAALALAAGSRRRRLTRRRVLGGALRMGALLALPGSLALGALGERFSARELAAYTRLERSLARLRGSRL